MAINILRHLIAMRLHGLARRMMTLANQIDDDLTGKTIWLPADPENEVHAQCVKVVERSMYPGKWIVRFCDSGHLASGFSYEHLKKGKVVL